MFLETGNDSLHMIRQASQARIRFRAGVHGRPCILSVGLACLGGCSGGVLDPKGPVGAAEKLILLDSLGIMLAIVIPTILATFAIAWWFRAGNRRAKYTPDWEYSGRIELVVWAIPAMVVLLLGGIGWIGSHDLDPAKPITSLGKPVIVDVVALDWKWLFIYPEQQIATVNTLVIPAGRPISFRLTSASVWNSFFIPQLGSQIYTMPGMTSRLNLMADETGDYSGLSAHFSGDGFSKMRFTVHAVSPDAFGRWTLATKNVGTALDAAAYASLAKPSEGVAPITYRSVAPDLFRSIAAMQSILAIPARPRAAARSQQTDGARK